MQILRAYKTELDPNREQRQAFLRHAGAARFAWNFGLARRIEARKAGEKYPNAVVQHRELNALKDSEFPWMREVSKCAPQEALRNLDKAFANFFRRVKDGKGKPGFPRFKSRKRGIGSFRLTGAIHVQARSVALPRIGTVRLKEKGYIPQDKHILCATVSECAGRWFVSIQVSEEVPNPVPATGEPIGVDLGIKTLATCSDGRTFANPRSLKRKEKHLARLQRRMCRQQKGSNRRARTKLRVGRLHYKIACVRKDTIHKATSALIARTKPAHERPSVIVLEDLNIAGMKKNRCLAKAVSDASMGEFSRQCEYKSKWAGSAVKKADRFYPSSKLCSACGALKAKLSLSERTYICEECGNIQNRDDNASQNLKSLAASVGGEWTWRPCKTPVGGGR